MAVAGLACPEFRFAVKDSFAAPAQTVKVDVNLVNVFATVQNDRGDYLTNLTRDDFRVYDDDVLQDIRIFQTENDVKSSIGFVMDSSGSMVDILPLMKSGIRDYVADMPPTDEFFVASFGTNIRLVHSASDGLKKLESGLLQMRAYGTSLMYDGLMFAMEQIQRSKPDRKALIVFSDGHDNGSTAGHGQVVQETQRTGVLLYFVAIGSKVLVDSHTIEDLTKISGGRAVYVPKRDPLTPVLKQIQTELARQYYLGYYISRRPGFHRIRVEVPDRNVRVRAKSGYLESVR
jgi:VWFA-related protein